jgi:hypothetical protein
MVCVIFRPIRPYGLLCVIFRLFNLMGVCMYSAPIRIWVTVCNVQPYSPYGLLCIFSPYSPLWVCVYYSSPDLMGYMYVFRPLFDLIDCCV